MNPLYLPLDALPGPVPGGAPLVYANPALPHITGRGIVVPALPDDSEFTVPEPGEGHLSTLIPWWAMLEGRDPLQEALSALAPGVGASEGCGYRLDGPFVLALDLTAPPLDAQGYPTRIDGFDVALGQLAWAMGHTDTVWLEQAGNDVWQLRSPTAPLATFCGRDLAHYGWMHVPALADIAHNHPDAARLALAAITLAKPWENR